MKDAGKTSFDRGNELWYEKNVCIYTDETGSKEQGKMLSGRASLVKKDQRIFFCWKNDPSRENEFEYKILDIDEWNLVEEVKNTECLNQTSDSSILNVNENDLWVNFSGELKSLKVHFGLTMKVFSTVQAQYPSLQVALKSLPVEKDMDTTSNDKGSITDMQKSTRNLPRLYFQNGIDGMSQFIKVLNRFFWLQRDNVSGVESDVYYVLDHHSVMMKNIEETRKNSYKAKPLSSFFQRTSNMFRKEFDRFTSLQKSESSEVTVMDVLKNKFVRKTTSVDNFEDRKIDYDHENVHELSKPRKNDSEYLKYQDISSDEWNGYMDNDGRITDTLLVFKNIYDRGVDPKIRTQVWPFLLGYYPFNSSHKERREIDERNRKYYENMKNQWKTITEEQLINFTEFTHRIHIIEKDVKRTDKIIAFYEGANNENSQKLYDILMTHCMFNFDLGYVQGMSDLLAPVFYLLKDECVAFWCFSRIIKINGANFSMDQKHMLTLLATLKTLVEFLWPDYCQFLKSIGSDDFYFAFSWLLINFKRQFSYCDVFYLWEKFLTQKICINYTVFLSATIIGSERNYIMKNNLQSDEIIRHFNKIDERINVYYLVSDTDKLIKNLSSLSYLPPQIQELIFI